MMYLYGDHVGGWGYGLGILAMVLFWGALILVIVAMVRYAGRDRSAGYPPETSAASPQPSRAEEILAERFARGEIGADEYRERLDVLRHGTGQEEKKPARVP
jgi:putative membrane protein